MTYKNELYMMKATRRRRSAMLGVLLLGFGAAGVMGACGSNEAAPPDSCATSSDTPSDTPTDMSTTCPAAVEEPCMLYRIPLVGNPSIDVELRKKYIAAFGSACYISEVNTFDCFYKKWQDACADAVKIGEVAGIVPYDKGYNCQPDGVGNYTLQIGPDVANKIQINYQAAPLECSLIDVDGTPTEINGPYRNLPQVATIKPGEDFYCSTGLVGDNGAPLNQKDWILQVNRKANGGKIRSDLAGFTYPCKSGCPEICTEPEFLKDPADKSTSRYDPYRAEVNHEIRRKDKRGCKWGTNANKNAAVISGKLNRYLYNNTPSADEVKAINKAPAYSP
jgi:hypothetical protein